MSIDFTLQELIDACIKVFLGNKESFETVSAKYELLIIDGKSVISKDIELNRKRRTFGFYYQKKVKRVFESLYMLGLRPRDISSLRGNLIPLNCPIKMISLYHVSM